MSSTKGMPKWYYRSEEEEQDMKAKLDKEEAKSMKRPATCKIKTPRSATGDQRRLRPKSRISFENEERVRDIYGEQYPTSTSKSRVRSILVFLFRLFYINLRLRLSIEIARSF